MKIPYQQKDFIEYFNVHGMHTKEQIYFFMKRYEGYIRSRRRKIADTRQLKGKKRTNFIRRYSPIARIERFYKYLKATQQIGKVDTKKLLEL